MIPWPFFKAIKPNDVFVTLHPKFAVDTAIAAKKINAKLLILGTETDKLALNPSKWRSIIKSVKQHYSGPLILASFSGKPNFSASQWSMPKRCGDN